MRRSPQNSPTRSRGRRQPAPTTTPAPASAARNVGSVEGLISLAVGVLVVLAALVPRSFKQVFLLAFGGGLVHRGLTGKSGFYRAIGIDTARGSRPGRVDEKSKSARD